MRKYSLLNVLALIIFFFIWGCKKEAPLSNSTYINPPPPPPSVKNTAPIVNAGPDTILSTNEITLNGTCVDAENNIRLILWEKISGPTSYNLSNINLLQPRLSNLIHGIYQFKVTVFDSLGLSGADIVKITVPNLPIIPDSTVIFKDRTWIQPWYNNIEIENINNWIPTGSSYKVYIRRDGSPFWIEVSPFSSGMNNLYDYFIETRPNSPAFYHYGSLYINYYGNDISDTPDVKLSF